MFLEEFTCIDSCGTGGIPVKIANIIVIVYNIIRIGVPIILIIIGMIDMAKAVTGKDEAEIKKAQNLLVKRGIAAALVFLMLSLVTLVLSAFDSNSKEDMGCVNCILSNGLSKENSGGNSGQGSGGNSGQGSGGSQTIKTDGIYFKETSYNIPYKGTTSLSLCVSGTIPADALKNATIAWGKNIDYISNEQDSDSKCRKYTIQSIVFQESRPSLYAEVMATLSYKGKIYKSNKATIRISQGALEDVNITSISFKKLKNKGEYNSYIKFDDFENLTEITLKPLQTLGQHFYIVVEPDEFYSVSSGSYYVDESKDKAYKVVSGGSYKFDKGANTFIFPEVFHKIITANSIGTYYYNATILDTDKGIKAKTPALKINVESLKAELYEDGDTNPIATQADTDENKHHILKNTTKNEKNIKDNLNYYTISIEKANYDCVNDNIKIKRKWKIYGDNRINNEDIIIISTINTTISNKISIERSGYCNINFYVDNEVRLDNLNIMYDGNLISKIKGKFYFMDLNFRNDYTIIYDESSDTIKPEALMNQVPAGLKIMNSGKTAEYSVNNIKKTLEIQGNAIFQTRNDHLEITWPSDYTTLDEYKQCYDDDDECWKNITTTGLFSYYVDNKSVATYNYKYSGGQPKSSDAEQVTSDDAPDGQSAGTSLRMNDDTNMPMIWFVTSARYDLDYGKQYYFLNIFASFREDSKNDTPERDINCEKYTIALLINEKRYNNIRFRPYYLEKTYVKDSNQNPKYCDVAHNGNSSFDGVKRYDTNIEYSVIDGLYDDNYNYGIKYLGTNYDNKYKINTLIESGIFNDSIDKTEYQATFAARSGLCYAFITSEDSNAFKGIANKIELNDKDLEISHYNNLEPFIGDDDAYNWSIFEDTYEPTYESQKYQCWDPDKYITSMPPWIQDKGLK